MTGYQRPTLLAVDTSTDACSVALSFQDRVFVRFEVAPRGHASRLMPFVADVMREAGIPYAALDALVLSSGPGSFTGLRVAAGAVQGMAFAAGKPVLRISTLATLALSALRRHPEIQEDCLLLPMLDARMDEIYRGSYRWSDGKLRAVEPDRLVKPEGVSLPAGTDASWDCLALGSGLVYRERFPAAFREWVRLEPEEIYPSAEATLDLAVQEWIAGARGEPAEQAMPVYLRDTVAWKKSNASIV